MKLKMKSCAWVNPHPPPHLPPIQLSAKRVLKQFGYDESFFVFLQSEVCRKLEEVDGDQKFFVDRWTRKEV